MTLLEECKSAVQPHAQLRYVMQSAVHWCDKAHELESELEKLKSKFINVVSVGNNLSNNAHEQLVVGGNDENLKICVKEWDELLDAIREKVDE